MTQSVQEWTRTLSSEPLPVMQRTLTGVRDLLRKSSVNHNRLSEIISRDPGFSLHVLQRLSSMPNQPKEPVTKISLAVPLLGMEVIEQASRTLPSLEERLKGPPRRGLIDCYSRATHAAIYAREIAKMRGWQEIDTLYTAALLHDLGEMALWSMAADRMRAVHEKIVNETARDNASREILGFTLEELSVQLSLKWRLPELIGESQGISDSYQPRPLTVMLASTLASDCSLGWRRARTDDDIELLAEFLEIPQDSATAHLHRIAAKAARELHRLPLPLPAFYLIPSDSAPPNSKTEEAMQAQSAVAPTKRDEPSPTDAQQPPPKPVATETPAVAAPEQPPKNRVNPLQQLLSSALQQMHEELGLSRAMFAMLSPDKTALKARFVVESEQQLSLKGFVLSMTKPSLFKALLNKPQAISLNKANAEKYLPMIPQSALEQMNNSGFVTMSVFIHGKAVGLFYADNGISGPGVTRQQYDNFKAICQKTIQVIGS
ncbi:MAG: HDOD domain-containing protein [Candidatus Thiodiazotropha sp.]